MFKQVILSRRNSIVTVAAVCLVLGTFGWIAFGDLYYERDDNGGTLLWRKDEAYLFMSVKRRGYRIKVRDYPLTALAEWFGASPLPSDEFTELTVIRVIPSRVERYVTRTQDPAENDPDLFTPTENGIFANCEGSLCKWAGDRFKLATQEEQKRFGGIYGLSANIDDKTINGWSTWGIGKVARDFEFSVQIGSELRLRIRQGNIYKSATDSPVVYLERTGRPSDKLWCVDGAPRRVSKHEYQAAFAIQP